jgi:predicted DNA-binding transcriptional regulator AlpA
LQSYDDYELTPAEVSERLSVGYSTLSAWRVSGEGPRWVRLGKRLIRYSRQGLADWQRSLVEVGE